MLACDGVVISMPSETYERLNRQWKSTCRSIFGRETTELSECGEWLVEDSGTLITRKSSVSGKNVAFAIRHYSEGSKWIGLDEVDFGKRFEPLPLDKIKDIDSLAEAVRERACYTGNVVLGNSKEVESSANITNSFYVMDSTFINDSKYIAYSTLAVNTESACGANNDSNSKFLVRGFETTYILRGFELLA